MWSEKMKSTVYGDVNDGPAVECFPEYEIDPIACLIFLYTWRRCEILEQSIDSLIADPNYPYRIWVIDNGNCDGTRELLLKHLYEGNIEKVIMEKRNWGINHALNQLKGLISINSWNPLIMQPAYVMITNDDMLYDSGWLKESIVGLNELNARHNIGVISPFHCKHLNGDYASLMRPTAYDDGYPLSEFISGNTWIMKTSVFLELPFYPTSHPTEGGDWYILEELKKRNYICARTREEIVHQHPETQGAGKFNYLGHW